MNPEIIFYDEPFVGQDPPTKAEVLELIKKLNSEKGITTVLITHDVPEALIASDYVYILYEGKVAGYGTPDDLLNSDKVLSFPPCFRCLKNRCGCENNFLTKFQIANWLSYINLFHKILVSQI